MSNNERTYRTDDEWEELIREFNAPSLTQGQFCEQRGISFHSFPESGASPHRRRSTN